MKTKNTTIFMGAGVSVPVGLPTAYSLADELIDHLVKKEWARNKIKYICRSERKDMRNKYDFIRFEALLEWIEDVYSNIDFFNFFNYYTEPSAIQLCAADCVKNGGYVVTTNFDDLIEYAFKVKGIQANTVDINTIKTIDDVNGVGNVIKLHGSWNYHREREIIKNSHNIQATMVDIIRTNPTISFNTDSKKILQKIINNRELIVVGYSASDSVDIVPTLYDCNPSKVYWLDYANCKPITYEYTDYFNSNRNTNSEYKEWEKLIKHWYNKGSDVTIISGNAEQSLYLLGFNKYKSKAVYNDNIWKNEVKKWVKKVKYNDTSGLGFASLIFEELRFEEEKLMALKESRGKRDKEVGWSTARKYYQIAQHDYFSEVGNYDDTLKMVKKAQKEAKLIGDYRVYNNARFLEARVFSMLGKYPESLQILDTLNPKIINSDFEICLKRDCESWIGRIYLWSSNYKKAIKYLESAYENAKEIGDLSPLIEIEYALAICSMQLGRITKANEILTLNEKRCYLHGYMNARLIALINSIELNILHFDFKIAKNTIKIIESEVEKLNEEDEIIYYFKCAEFYLLTKKYDLAKIYYEKILEIVDFLPHYKGDALIGVELCEILQFNSPNMKKKIMDITATYYYQVLRFLFLYKLNYINKTELGNVIKFSKLSGISLILLKLASILLTPRRF